MSAPDALSSWRHPPRRRPRTGRTADRDGRIPWDGLPSSPRGRRGLVNSGGVATKEVGVPVAHHHPLRLGEPVPVPRIPARDRLDPMGRCAGVCRAACPTHV